MKTAIQVILDEIEMEHNNGVEISQKQLWKMLFKAKSTEKQQIIDAYNSSSWEIDKDIEGHHYYDEKFKNKQPLM